MRLNAACIMWFLTCLFCWRVSGGQQQNNPPSPPQQPPQMSDTDKQTIALEVQQNTENTVSDIKHKCGFREDETDNKKRRKANECINKTTRLLQQSNRLNDMLFAAAQGQASRKARSAFNQPPSPALIRTLNLGAGAGTPSSGPPQAFVGGSLSGTPTTCGTPGNGLNNTALIRVHRAVMTPQVAMDDFGRRLGMAYIVFQVTVENGSKDYQFMLHDVSIDFSTIYGQPAGTYSYSASSQDLSLLRGVPEKGADLDRRNAILHVLQGIGSVAGAVSGLTDFADVMGPSVAIFNGSFLQGYTTIAPDHTSTQLNRLSDSAFVTNTVIDKQRAKTIAMFIPADQLLSREQQKEFRKDPYAFMGFADSTQALNEADVCVDGTFIQAVTVAAPTLSSAKLENPSNPPAGNQDRVLDIAGNNLVAGDTVVVLTSAAGATSRATVVTTDGKNGTAQVHLPSDFALETTTVTLQSTLSPSLNSGAGIKITTGP